MKSNQSPRMEKEDFRMFDPGFGGEHFRPRMAGHTPPNPDYSVTRKNTENFLFAYVLAGRGTVELDGHVHEVEAGDAYILPRGSSHTECADREEPFEKLWLAVHGRLVEHLLEDYELTDCVLFGGFGNAVYMQNLWAFAQNARSVDADGCAILLHRFISALSVFHRFGMPSSDNDVAWQLRAHIDRSYAEDVSIAAIAASLGYSKSRLGEIFRAEFHMSPHEYRIKRRMDVARVLLLNTAMSIGDVALSVGFSDSHYFTNCFRRTFGEPPGRFRRREGRFE